MNASPKIRMNADEFFAEKLVDYFQVHSIRHYLVVAVEKRKLVHHARTSAELIETQVLSARQLNLSPPGITLKIADLFGDKRAEVE